MSKKPLVIIAGPTAVGKSKLAVSLAKELEGEIISSDSMQVYQQMDIGSAKISKEEQDGIPHHLLDVLQPTEAFDVVQFQILAKKALAKIYEREHLPIVTGGSGFYIQALLYDIDFGSDREDRFYRKKLQKLEQEQGAQALYEQLLKVDPESARRIHPHNTRRILRALEFYYETGEPISSHNQRERKRESPYTYTYFVLTDIRSRLYEQIEKRVDQMMEQGFLEEVMALKEQGCHSKMVSMQGLGYRQLLSFLEGEGTLEEAVSKIKRETRHFAKRQLTWFRREKEAIWIDKSDFAYDNKKILAYMKGCIR